MPSKEPARLTGKVLVWKYVRLITPWVNIYAFIFLVGRDSFPPCNTGKMGSR